jgi:RNA polymerase sigma factor (TIGR02999 family)
VILPRLREMAAGHLRRERHAEPVSPTELIHEVWLRQTRQGGWQIKDREHFFAIAGCAMRRVLVDFARTRLALKRGGLNPAMPASESAMALVDVDGAAQVVEMGLLMDKLGEVHPKSLPIVDLHHFAGFSFEEIARITGLSERQVRYLWGKGRDWLREQLTAK